MIITPSLSRRDVEVERVVSGRIARRLGRAAPSFGAGKPSPTVDFEIAAAGRARRHVGPRRTAGTGPARRVGTASSVGHADLVADRSGGLVDAHRAAAGRELPVVQLLV